MKAVLMAIHPKWCEKIFNGKKTIEVRITAPQLATPFKVYVYCTKQKIRGELIICRSKELSEIFGYGSIVGVNKGVHKDEDDLLCGKVVGEFVCETVITDKTCGKDALFNGAACLTQGEAEKYSCGKVLYGLHITAPKLYDKPKELSEFYKHDNTYDNVFSWVFEKVPIKRPPQSWCYVEEIEE